MAAVQPVSTDAYRRGEVLRILEQQCPFGVFETDSHGVILNVNDELLRIFDLNRSAIEGQHFDALAGEFQDDWSRAVELHFSQMLNGISGEFQAGIAVQDGQHKYLRIAYYPVYNGVFLGTVGMVFDETSKRRVLAELYQLRGEMSDA